MQLIRGKCSLKSKCSEGIGVKCSLHLPEIRLQIGYHHVGGYSHPLRGIIDSSKMFLIHDVSLSSMTYKCQVLNVGC